MMAVLLPSFDTLLYFFNYHIQNRWVFREEEKKA